MEPVGYVLKVAQQRLRLAMDTAMRDLGVTAPQYAVLRYLGESPGMSGADLARRAFVTPQTMNRIIVNLDKAGLIERAPHAKSGRVLDTRLSPAGRRLLENCRERVDAVENTMLSGLTAAEREQLRDLLQRCADSLPASHRQ
jgi:DNA-binding MarR family transcriptional regulator